MENIWIISLFVCYVIAQTPLEVNIFEHPDCTEAPLIGFNFSDPNATWTSAYALHNGSFAAFQGIVLNRSLTKEEQLDLSTTNASFPDMANANFVESIWNWDNSCRSVNSSTAVTYWQNEGLIENNFGQGWGWNGTVWINRTF